LKSAGILTTPHRFARTPPLRGGEFSSCSISNQQHPFSNRLYRYKSAIYDSFPRPPLG
jgi:hypothetical protein